MRKISMFVIAVLFLLAAVVAQDGNETAVESNVSDVNLSESNLTDVQSNLELVLSRNRYLPNETVSGVVRLKLDSAVGSNKVMSVRFGNNVYKKTIKEILNATNLTFTELKVVLNPVNPSDSKVVHVASDSPAMLALKLPSEIPGGVGSVEMTVAGVPANKLFNPYFDVGNDGNMDWYYLGNFVGWATGFLKSEDLDESGKDAAYLNDDNSDYFCEVISVPRTKDLKVSVKYKKRAEGGNIKAAVFSIISGDPSWVGGEGSVCDLEDVSAANLMYRSCEIHLGYAAEGKLQVCVYSEIPEAGSGTPLYEITTDSLQATSSSYTCAVSAGSGICIPHTYSNDYFIKVQPADYTGNLVGEVNVADWNTYPNSFAEAIENYVGTDVNPEGVCTDPICTVPITIYGNGSGTLTFSNLKISYEDNTKVASSLFGIEKANPEIGSVNGNDLSINPVTLEIPLRVFGKFVTGYPSFVFSEQAVGVEFNDYSSGAVIRVYRDAIPQSEAGMVLEETIKTVDSALADKDKATLLKLLGLDTVMSEKRARLGEYSLMLSGSEDEALDSEVEGFVADLPKKIRLKGSLIDSFVAEPGDITSDVKTSLADSEAYAFQFKADVLAYVKTYEIEYNSGEVVTAVLVKKKITPKESLKKINVYEMIPKSVVSSVEDVKFEQTPKVVNPDPVVSWYFPELKESEISYAIKTDAGFSIYDFKTIIAPSGEEEAEEAPETVCGDGFCDAGEDESSCPEDCVVKKESGLGLIVGMAVGLLLVALYVLAFLNPVNFRKAALGGMPFKTKAQMDSVMGFIAASKAKGVSAPNILVALKKNKWTDRQVTVAYRAVEMDQELDSVLKNVPQKSKGNGPMKVYLLAGLQRGLDINVVSNYLVKGGWARGEINSAYMIARIGMPFRLLLGMMGIKIK